MGASCSRRLVTQCRPPFPLPEMLLPLPWTHSRHFRPRYDLTRQISPICTRFPTLPGGIPFQAVPSRGVLGSARGPGRDRCRRSRPPSAAGACVGRARLVRDYRWRRVVSERNVRNGTRAVPGRTAERWRWSGAGSARRVSWPSGCARSRGAPRRSRRARRDRKAVGGDSARTHPDPAADAGAAGDRRRRRDGGSDGRRGTP